MTNHARRRALERQVRRLGPQLARMQRLSLRLSWVRVAVAALIVGVCGAAFLIGNVQLFFVGLIGLTAVFAFVVRVHRRLDRTIERHEAWVRLKNTQIARGGLDWDGLPDPAAVQRRPEHPFEGDLDLVGPRGLHRLVDTSLTQEGSARLRAWLTATMPDVAEVARRQPIVRELVPRALLRDKLLVSAMQAADDTGRWRANELLEWLDRHEPNPALRRWVIGVGALAIVNIVLFTLAALGYIEPIWRYSFIIYVAVYYLASRDMGEPFHEAMDLMDMLRRLIAIFQRLETYSYYQTPHLEALCAPFLDPDHRPSAHIKRVARLAAAAGIRGNPFVWFLVNVVVPWDLFVTYWLDRRKTELIERAPAWLDVWFDFEALSALANLAYLNPEYTFPDVMAESDGSEPVFAATALGHPLIPTEDRVANDFTFERLGEIGLITGSNMAGKSTFLKAVGVNIALAYAGGPVSAGAMRTGLFRPFTSIRITDSVTDGISYFYAEVKRLRALLDALQADETLPLLYLIDEVFRGTNNRERLIGSRSLIRAMADGRGVGLIATHDLELVSLADEIDGITNYHFRDDVADGRMQFDYRLHAGPCPTTNALKIMRMEGLPG